MKRAIILSILLLSTGLFARAEETTASDVEISRLINALGDDNFQARKTAADALRAIGFPAFEKLRTAREKVDVEIARTARKLLGNYEEIQRLLDKLPQDWHSTLYYSGLTETQAALVEHGEVIVPYIAQRLKTEKNPLYHFNCVSMLNEFHTPEAITVLRTLLKDSNVWTRVEAAWSLGNAKDTKSLSTLLDLSKNDPDDNVKKEALLALGRIANIRIFALTPNGIIELASNLYVTDDARKEVEKIVMSLEAKHERPDVEKVVAHVANVGDPTVLNTSPEIGDPSLNGDWNTKVLQAPKSNEYWIISRYEKPLPETPQPAEKPEK